MNTLIPADREKVPANTGYYKIIVTNDKIIFYVPDQNKKDFMAWLESLPLFRILEAYHRTVYVK